MLQEVAGLYRQAYQGLSRKIWLLAIVMVINRSGTMVLAFLTLYTLHLGYSVEKSGLVVAMYGLGSIAGAYLGGKVSDRFGFYHAQVWSLILGGILFILVGRLHHFTAFCTGIFFMSMVIESFRPANTSAIAHYSTPQNRTQSFSLVRLAINIGWGVGAALGGILASFDYSLLFLVDGATCIFAGILLRIILPPVKPDVPEVAEEASFKSKSPFRDTIFLKFMGLQILFAMCFFQLFTTVPLFFKTQLKLDELYIGIVMAANGLMIALFEMVLVFKLEGKLHYLKLMAYGTLLMGVSYALLHLPFESGLIVAGAFILVITFSEMVAMPFMNTYYISRASSSNRGQYAGIYTMGWSIAQSVGSAGGTYLASQLGFGMFWWIVFALCAATAAGYWFLNRN